MTTTAADVGSNQLDLSPDSVQIKGRKGETLVWEIAFNQNDTEGTAQPVDVSEWTFQGGVRDGSNPTHLVMDVAKIADSNNNRVQCFFDTSLLTTNVSANSSRDFYYEVEAEIPTVRIKSDGSTITVKRVVNVGILSLTADIFNAPVSS